MRLDEGLDILLAKLRMTRQAAESMEDSPADDVVTGDLTSLRRWMRRVG